MFEDLELVLDGRLPIIAGGQEFYVPEPSAKEGLRLQRLFAYGSARIDDMTELREILNILGPVWQEMIDANVGESKAMAAGRLALIHYAIGPTAATNFIAGDDLGKDLPPKRLLRKVRASAGTAKGTKGFARLGRTGRGTRAAGAGSPS